ncbi:hypothetical protein [Legionella impletisoli]|uniref:Transmembrane protein n=1 Tax=Legionella impletisoli TaxID=343510 RepID=A0A917JXA6_9GAMM|nr:hypothetical protein [Legionella impletisoli]GGI86541.1 hypothetical protein GCM10007966_13970 [Legionella impletisoli]
MKKKECSKIGMCLWTLRFEILGVLLLVVGTCLTISTSNGLGIIALFTAGVILCLFNKLLCYIFSSKQPSCPICNAHHSYHSENSSSIQAKEDREAKEAMDNEGGNQTNIN